MKTTPITQNACQLTRFGFVNCYLVRENDGFTLVDTGMGSGSGDLILNAAYRLGAVIRRIVLTHAHVDHVGSVDALMSKLGTEDTELISNARSVPLLAKPPNLSLWPGEPSGKIKGSVSGIDAKPTRLLEEGDTVGSLRCIETPGHIPGHLSFLDERDGTLYAGDALTSMGDLRVSSDSPWYFPMPKFVTWNAASTIASAKKLLNYRVERFACGHGQVKDGGIAALQAAIAKSKQ